MKKHLAVLFPILITVLAFLPSLNNGFVNWDDPAYVLRNYLIKSLSWNNLNAIFSTYVNGNYQPLSVLSFAIEDHFFGLSPKIFHLTNLVLHAVNVGLMYSFIFLLTRNIFSAVAVSLLFGIHPMHVESVAWITERKDVLFSFFYLLSLIFYVKYSANKNPSWKLYIASLIIFLFSLLSKPTAISLPIVLLLTDYLLNGKIDRRSIIEKIPFFLLSLVFGFLAMGGTPTPTVDIYPISKVIEGGFSVSSPYPDPFSFVERIGLIGHALLLYLVKSIWVIGLACYYPYPTLAKNVLPSFIYFSPVILIVILFCIAYTCRFKRYAIFGILFFLVTIFFNLPIKSLGHTSFLGDRFTYLPYIGLFLIIGENLTSLARRSGNSKILLALFTVVILFLFSQTWSRCKVWQNSGTLWTDVISQYPAAEMAYYNRANYWIEQSQLELAIRDYTKTVNLNPQYYGAWVNRGIAYALQGNIEAALNDYSRAIEINPHKTNVYLNRASLYVRTKQYDRAIKDCDRILRSEPHHAKALEIRMTAEKELTH